MGNLGLGADVLDQVPYLNPVSLLVLLSAHKSGAHQVLLQYMSEYH